MKLVPALTAKQEQQNIFHRSANFSKLETVTCSNKARAKRGQRQYIDFM
jgi:hypothetical protein